MASTGRPRLLIVEDDLDLARIYQRALASLVESRIVERVDQLFEHLLDFQPHVVLLDIMLERELVHPIADAGVHILERIRATSARDLPVVIVTGAERPEIEAQCRALGVVDYLRKPLPVELLRHAVRGALAARQQRVLIVSEPEDVFLDAARWVVRDAVAEVSGRYQPVLADDLGARPESRLEAILSGVDENDILLLLLGNKYGRPVGVGDQSLIEHAYLRARAMRKPVLVFSLAVPERQPRLDAFLARAAGCHCIQQCQDLQELLREVLRALEALAGAPPPASSPLPPAGRPIRILFLAANPRDGDRVRLDEECREVERALRSSEYRDLFEVRSQWAVRWIDFQDHLLRYRPEIVHFSGHGSRGGEIVLEDDQGRGRPVARHTLAELFRLLRDNIRCVVLNACFAVEQARAIASEIDCVVGMSQHISDPAAIAFATAFYRALGYGLDVKKAFELGRLEIDTQGLADGDVPQLIADRVLPETVQFVGRR